MEQNVRVLPGGEAEMDADIDILITQSAKRLELPLDSDVVRHALDVGRLAVEEGFGTDVAFEMARSELIRATLTAA